MLLLIDSCATYFTSTIVVSDAHKRTFPLESVTQMRNRAGRKNAKWDLVFLCDEVETQDTIHFTNHSTRQRKARVL